MLMDTFLCFWIYIERIDFIFMNTHKKITFLGGDARQIMAASELASYGYCVSAFFGEEEKEETLLKYISIKDAIENSDIIILPLPASVDGVLLNAPFLKSEQISLLKIVDIITVKKMVIGGRIPENIMQALIDKGVWVIDYFKSEAFQIENAYTTSEAALSIAMNNLKKNIRGARFAVTGYGRIARTLTELLLKLGAQVCVLARKESDIAWAKLSGASAMRIEPQSINALAHGYDIIFNTVPSWLFFESFLSSLDKNTLIIDLASSPGGVDVSAAKKLSSKVLWASSLPGKYAPESAGKLIANCIKDIVSEVDI